MVSKSDEDEPHKLIAGLGAEDDEVEEEPEDLIPLWCRRPHLATDVGKRNPRTTGTYSTSPVGEPPFPYPPMARRPPEVEGNGGLAGEKTRRPLSRLSFRLFVL